MDHDQRFKKLIQEFFESFMQLFFAEWAMHLDFSEIEWLDKELYPELSEGSLHVLDLVARLPGYATEQQELATLVLVHIEIESPDRTTLLKPRLPYYYHFLRDKYQLPVLPVVIYLKVALDGVGIDEYSEHFRSLEVNRFQYLYVGLPGLDAIEYVQGDNWLGVALSALMDIPDEQVAQLGADALQRLSEAPLTPQQKFLLGDCVGAYLTLDEQQKQTFDNLLLTESYQGAKQMNLTSYDIGRQEGRQEERFELACSVLEEKFGILPKEVREALSTLSQKEVQELLVKAGTANSLSELGWPVSLDKEND